MKSKSIYTPEDLAAHEKAIEVLTQLKKEQKDYKFKVEKSTEHPRCFVFKRVK